MSSTTESTLGVKWTQLQDEVGRRLALTKPYSTDEQADIDAIVDSGVRNVYFPQAEQGIDPGYNWGFLKIIKTGEVVTGGTGLFALPDDFNGGISALHLTSVAGDPIPIVDQESFRMQKIGAAASSGTIPVNATIYLSTAPTATESERYSVELHPIPTGNVTLTYSYNIIPDTITSGAPCPNGSQVHGETFIASCIAIAEERDNEGDSKPFYDAFIKRLAGSIQLDKTLNKALPGSTMHSATAVALTTFASEYNHLVSSIGFEMGLGFNMVMYTWDQLQSIQRVLDRGIHKFYWPEVEETHIWSFMTPSTTIATVAEQEDYDLPTTVASLIGDIFHESEQIPRVESTTLDKILTFRHLNTDTNGIPRYYALRPKGTDGTGEQVTELLLWPTPDTIYTLNYKYEIRPTKISASAMYTLAGPEHGETILLSCLALLEESVNGDRHQAFDKALRASIARDRRNYNPGNLGYNGDRSSHHGHNDYHSYVSVTHDGISYPPI